jgi:hypothetical protein
MARTSDECQALFAENHGKNMIEVLVPGRLTLPEDLVVTFFHADDYQVGREVIRAKGRPWQAGLSDCRYLPEEQYVRRTREFIAKAMANSGWRGDGLEFDRV